MGVHERKDTGNHSERKAPQKQFMGFPSSDCTIKWSTWLSAYILVKHWHPASPQTVSQCGSVPRRSSESICKTRSYNWFHSKCCSVSRIFQHTDTVTLWLAAGTKLCEHVRTPLKPLKKTCSAPGPFIDPYTGLLIP